MRPDACREWRAVLGAAVLDRLDPGDGIALQAHLDGCADCRAELRELREVAEVLPLADIDRVVGDDREPSHELGEHVLARVASARAGARRQRRGRLLAVAAAMVFVVALVAVLTTRDDGAEGVNLELTGTEEPARVELHALDAGTEVHFLASGLDDGEWYWLWVTGDDDRRVAAGTFRGTGRDLDLTMTAALALDDTRRVWVTDADDTVVLDARL